LKKNAETFEANDMVKERYFDKQLKKYEDKLDWQYLSLNPSLTPALIEKYEDKLYWDWLSKTPSLTPALIEKYIDKLDLHYLSMNPSLTPALIEKYKGKWNWNFLSRNPSLTPALIEKYIDKVDLDYLSMNPSLTPALIEKYIDKLDLDYLSMNPALTPAFIEKYKGTLDWEFLSRNPSLTPALIEKYKGKLNWVFLSENPSLTPALIEKYIDKLDWRNLSRNPSLTPALIEKYKDKLYWNFLSRNPALTPALIEKYIDKWDWVFLSQNPSLTPALIEKYKGTFYWDVLSKNPSLFGNLHFNKRRSLKKNAETFEANDMVKERYFDKQLKKYKDKLDWGYLSKNPSLTPALIEKYKDKLRWRILSENPSLTPALIEKYKDKLYWDYLSMNPALTPALIEKYIDKVNWDWLSRNPSLTPALIEKYEDKINWALLSQNPAFTPALIEKYIDKNVSWAYLSQNPSLTPALIEKYIDNWDWEILSSNPSLTPALIEKYKGYKGPLDWEILSRNPSLTLALIEKYIDNWDWVYLSDNPSLTPAFIEKYKDKLYWRRLSQNPALTPALIEKYKDRLDWDVLSQNPSLFGNLHVKKAEEEKSKKPHTVTISRSSNSEKKLMAVFEDSEGKKMKTTHFGQRGASDYTKHGDKERMERYLERHGGGTTTSTKEDWKDPTTAGALSRWILWNKPSLSGSFADYKRRFGLKGTLNVSKSAEERKCKSCGKPATNVVQEGSFCFSCLPINLGAETFEAKSPAQKSLNKWTKEDWGTKSGKPSTQGEEATGERYLPRKARKALTDKEYARTSAKKRRDMKQGKQFSPQPDDVEEKVKKYRSETFEAEKPLFHNVYCTLCGQEFQSVNRKWKTMGKARKQQILSSWIQKHYRKKHPEEYKKWFDFMYENGYDAAYHEYGLPVDTKEIFEAEQVFEAIEGKGSKARFTDQPDPKTYRDTGLRQKARNDLLKGTKGGDAGEWSARKAQMAATRYRTLYEDKYGEGKNPYF